MINANTFLGLTRLSLGLIFLWAFLDKVFGLGFATETGKAWINGVSPTLGYLTHATRGPLASVFQSLAGSPVIDALFMSGLLFVGLTLTLGIMVRLGSAAGIAIVLLIYASSSLPPEHHPFLDEHLIYSLILASFMDTRIGEYPGLGKWWKKQVVIRERPFLY